jgi:hypothetical protein
MMRLVGAAVGTLALVLLAGCTSTVVHNVPGPTVTERSTETVTVTDAPSAILVTVEALPTVAPPPVHRSKPKPKPKPTPVDKLDITLEVFGNGSSSLITYSKGDDIEQDANASLPWSRKQRAVDTGDLIQISAQDQDGTSITCEIVGVNGKVLDKETSTGSYAIASCQTSGLGL